MRVYMYTDNHYFHACTVQADLCVIYRHYVTNSFTTVFSPSLLSLSLSLSLSPPLPLPLFFSLTLTHPQPSPAPGPPPGGVGPPPPQPGSARPSSSNPSAAAAAGGFKFSVPETLDHIKEEFGFLQSQTQR